MNKNFEYEVLKYFMLYLLFFTYLKIEYIFPLTLPSIELNSFIEPK